MKIESFFVLGQNPPRNYCYHHYCNKYFSMVCMSPALATIGSVAARETHRYAALSFPSDQGKHIKLACSTGRVRVRNILEQIGHGAGLTLPFQ